MVLILSPPLPGPGVCPRCRWCLLLEVHSWADSDSHVAQRGLPGGAPPGVPPADHICTYDHDGDQRMSSFTNEAWSAVFFFFFLFAPKSGPKMANEERVSQAIGDSRTALWS